MSKQHDAIFEFEYKMNNVETVDGGRKNDLQKNPCLEIDGLIVNNQLFEFQQAVDGKVIFTLTEDTDVIPHTEPVKKQNDPVKLTEIRNDLPVDESVRPGPRPQRRDNQLSQKELDRRNRRRAINRDCARRARQRRQRNETELEEKIKFLEDEKASWERKYSDLEGKYKSLSTFSQGMDLLK